jgi:hypothetical protein
MAELKWIKDNDDCWFARGSVWFIQPYEDQGYKLMMYDFDEANIGSLCDTVDELKTRAQAIENILDPQSARPSANALHAELAKADLITDRRDSCDPLPMIRRRHDD